MDEEQGAVNDLQLRAYAAMEIKRRRNKEMTVYGIYSPSGELLRCVQDNGKGEFVTVDKRPVVKVPEKLERFVTVKKRFKIAFGGRSGGKSYTFSNIMLAKAKDYGDKTLCLREFQSSIKDSVHSMLAGAMSSLGFEGFEVTNDTIRLNDDDVFRFKGLARNPDSVKSSHGFKYAWCEEAQSLSQNSLQMLTPTIREKGSEIWMAMNPKSSNDPVSRRFLNPFYSKLLADGFYEDDLHLIAWINFEDNPWHGEELDMERQHDKEIMSADQYRHVWEGHFNDDIDNGLIRSEWFDACIDAHVKLGFKPSGIRTVAFDPSDTGGDAKGLCVSYGQLVEKIDAKDDGDSCEGVDWATAIALSKKADSFVWDGDGLGVSLKREIERSLGGSGTNMMMFKGSTAPDPGKYEGGNKPVDNKDAFYNKRAQYYFTLRDRIYNTYLAVTKGKYADPDHLISISPDCGNIDALRTELCRIPIKHSNTGKLQLMAKPEMKKLGIKSPNMADALMMSLFGKIDSDVQVVDIDFEGWG